MANKESAKTTLIEIRDLLKLEMDKFTAINSEMIDNKNDFQKINTNYQKYSSQIDKGREHINQLKRREFFENLFVYIGFVFFFCCVAIVILRRFPLHLLVLRVVSFFHKIVSYLNNLVKDSPVFEMAKENIKENITTIKEDI